MQWEILLEVLRAGDVALAALCDGEEELGCSMEGVGALEIKGRCPTDIKKV